MLLFATPNSQSPHEHCMHAAIIAVRCIHIQNYQRLQKDHTKKTSNNKFTNTFAYMYLNFLRFTYMNNSHKPAGLQLSMVFTTGVHFNNLPTEMDPSIPQNWSSATSLTEQTCLAFFMFPSRTKTFLQPGIAHTCSTNTTTTKIQSCLHSNYPYYFH